MRKNIFIRDVARAGYEAVRGYHHYDTTREMPAWNDLKAGVPGQCMMAVLKIMNYQDYDLFDEFMDDFIFEGVVKGFVKANSTDNPELYYTVIIEKESQVKVFGTFDRKTIVKAIDAVFVTHGHDFVSNLKAGQGTPDSLVRTINGKDQVIDAERLAIYAHPLGMFKPWSNGYKSMNHHELDTILKSDLNCK